MNNAVDQLMHLAMPSFEHFLEHSMALKTECEKAGALTTENAALFDKYRQALLDARGEYDAAIAKFIGEQFTSEEVDLLVTFYGSPTRAAVEKALGLSPLVNNIGTAWTTRVLESCPDVWKMIMDSVANWQRKNQPEDAALHVPDAPPNREWKRVPTLKVVDAPKQAEEFVPNGEV